VTVGDFAIIRSATMFVGIQLVREIYRCFLPKDSEQYKKLGVVTGIEKGDLNLVILRSICGITCFIFITWAISLAPLTLVYVLFNTAPFWGSILGYWVNNEPIIALEYAAMVICFVAILGVTFGGTKDEEIATEISAEVDEEI
jgi:multidrug transporter EmrE-like cation transporter